MGCEKFCGLFLVLNVVGVVVNGRRIVMDYWEEGRGVWKCREVWEESLKVYWGREWCI